MKLLCLSAAEFSAMIESADLILSAFGNKVKLDSDQAVSFWRWIPLNDPLPSLWCMVPKGAA